MVAPVPTVPTGQPLAGSTATFEYSLAYDASTGAIVASPVFVQPNVTGEISLTFNPQTSNYDAYVTSGDDAWSYAVKTGMQGTISLKVAAPHSDPTIAPLVNAGLKAGNKAMILFRVKNPDGSYFFGAAVVGLATATPVRGVTEVTITGPTTGKVGFQAAA